MVLPPSIPGSGPATVEPFQTSKEGRRQLSPAASRFWQSEKGRTHSRYRHENNHVKPSFEPHAQQYSLLPDMWADFLSRGQESGSQ